MKVPLRDHKRLSAHGLAALKGAGVEVKGWERAGVRGSEGPGGGVPLS